ncbi:MAG: hypothetical protein V4649_19875 [Bacteroidota bacterium]
MNYFKDFDKILRYIIVIAVLYLVYAWAGITGTKITGDDNEVKETRDARQNRNNFYHK